MSKLQKEKILRLNKENEMLKDQVNLFKAAWRYYKLKCDALLKEKYPPKESH